MNGEAPITFYRNFIEPLSNPRPQIQLDDLPWRLGVVVPLIFLAAWLCPRRLRDTWDQLTVKTAFWPWDRLAVVVCLSATLVYAGVSQGIFLARPHTPDELVYFMMAKQMERGQISSPLPERWEFFQANHCVTHDGRWFGRFHPGWPLMLAAGMKFRGEWLVNPVFGALTLWLIFLLGKRTFSSQVGFLAAFLALVSPFVLFMSGSYLSHTSTAFFLLLFIYRTLEWEEKGGKNGLGEGLLIGIGFVIRPLTAVGVVLPLVIRRLWQLAAPNSRSRKEIVIWGLGVCAGFAPFVGGYLWYNQALTGSPWQFPFNLETPNDRLGFGSGTRDFGIFTPGEDQLPQGHTPYRALLNTLIHLFGLSIQFFGFPFLSFLPLWWYIRFRKSPSARSFLAGRGTFLWAFPVSLALAYTLYWDHSALSFFGPRYYYAAFPALMLLSAEGIRRAFQRPSAKGVFLPLLLAGLFLEAAVNYWPVLTLHHASRSRSHEILWEKVRAEGLHKAVVFSKEYQMMGFPWNEPSFQGDVVFARDRGDTDNWKLEPLFPGYRFYRAKVVALPGLEAGKMKFRTMKRRSLDRLLNEHRLIKIELSPLALEPPERLHLQGTWQ